MLATSKNENRALEETIAACLCRFEDICGLALPYPQFPRTIRSDNTMSNSTNRYVSSPGKYDLDKSAILGLQQILDLVSTDTIIKDLVWSPLSVSNGNLSQGRIYNFQKDLREWKNGRDYLMSDADFGIQSSDLTMPHWAHCTIPPPPTSAISAEACFASAMYHFAMARSMWALAVLGEDWSMYERSAYLHFHRTMRCVAMIKDSMVSPCEPTNTYRSCEALGFGLLPILYITGQCMPNPSWFQWILQTMKDIGHEGLFNGRILAMSLEGQHTFDSSNEPNVSRDHDQFPPPAARAVSVLIPEVDGRSYTCYYASPRRSLSPKKELNFSYHPTSQTRWSCSPANGDLKLTQVTTYNQTNTMSKPLSSEWLLDQPPVREWVTWSSHTTLDINRILQDHMRGSGMSPSIP